MKQVGRNEPCPCGSGKKYKNCHENVKGSIQSSNKAVLLIALLIVLILIGVYSLYNGSQSNRPNGPAPAGKVWSEEHGHWHDI